MSVPSVLGQLVDLPRLDAWLGDQLPSFGAELSVERISLGASKRDPRAAPRGETVGMLRRPPLHHHDRSRPARSCCASSGC